MPDIYKRLDFTIDQQLALPTSARRLSEEFAGTFGSRR